MGKIVVEDLTSKDGQIELLMAQVSAYMGSLAKAKGLSAKDLTEIALTAGEQTCALFKLSSQLSQEEEEEIRKKVQINTEKKIDIIKEMGVDRVFGRKK